YAFLLILSFTLIASCWFCLSRVCVCVRERRTENYAKNNTFPHYIKFHVAYCTKCTFMKECAAWQSCLAMGLELWPLQPSKEDQQHGNLSLTMVREAISKHLTVKGAPTSSIV
ncbi:hypothetical protein AAFF_G00297230, partial [Aldrovandia affinis]